MFASLQVGLGPTIFRRLHADWRSDQRRAVEACLGAPAGRVWVADTGAAGVAGFVAARLDRDRLLGELTMLAVDPAHQGRGIGTRLTAFALDRLREAGGDPGHAPARRTYERGGFTRLPLARYFKAL